MGNHKVLLIYLQVGEGEKLVKALFAVAREVQPSIIFIGKIAWYDPAVDKINWCVVLLISNASFNSEPGRMVSAVKEWLFSLWVKAK